MPIYEFKKENGEIIEQIFPIGKCPSEITCEDGKKAIRIISNSYIAFFDGNGSSNSNASKLNKQMNRRQKQADSRMRQRWKSVKKK